MYTPTQLDKTRNFRYGMKAIHQIEKALDTKIGLLDLESLSMYELSVIVWAGLVHEDKELTPERVMELIDDHSSIPKITESMSKAFEDAFGVSEGNDHKKDTPKN